ncbi:MAG: hypothetical protein IPK87_07675 [Planctomycetes bacterium]|nr:hypothetical protein [Planctomycetota bacterium]
MRVVRVFLGIFVVLLLAGGVAGGVWVLYEHGGGGLPVSVAFDDGKGISSGDEVVFGDRLVGRVNSVDADGDGVLVHAVIAAEHAELLRDGCRFWIDSRLGSTILNFDRSIGVPALPGQQFKGLSERPQPDPELTPAPLARPLKVRPVWLCEVRATLTTRVGTEESIDRTRKGAGAIVHVNAQGDLLVLCPAWLIEPAGPVLAQSIRVEMIGEGTRVADLVEQRGEHAVLLIRATAYRENAATLWPHELADGQGLVLTDFDGASYPAEVRQGGVEFKGVLEQGNVALVDGTKLAGFALPNVGRSSGMRWISLHGVGTTIDIAQAKLE